MNRFDPMRVAVWCAVWLTAALSIWFVVGVLAGVAGSIG